MFEFDFIETKAGSAATKFMEWCAAFGLMITLVWLYSLSTCLTPNIIFFASLGFLLLSNLPLRSPKTSCNKT
ncbi:MAG: Bax inhibitor-1/YccA family protein, partial [Methanosarcinales archaeon]|nr:Bax inhibitor-1/YccA family protein [Methanosarcinales archaeon]